MTLPEIQYKSVNGVLHIGGGRFFYAQEPVAVSEQEAEKLLQAHRDLEVVSGGANTPPNTEDEQGGAGGQGEQDDGLQSKRTAAELKKLSAAEQKALIEELGGDVEGTSNESERIELIMQLQGE